MTKEEIREILIGIIEDNKNSIPTVKHPKCNKCIKRTKWMCEVYPNGIPKKIMHNEQECPDFQAEAE